MKRSRRVVSLVLTFMLVSCLLVPMSSAAEVTRPDQGSILINGINSADLNIQLWHVMEAEFSTDNGSLYYTPTDLTLKVILRLFGDSDVTVLGVTHTISEWYKEYTDAGKPHEFSKIISQFFQHYSINEWTTFANELYIEIQKAEEPPCAENVVPMAGSYTFENMPLGMYLISPSKESSTEACAYIVPALCALPMTREETHEYEFTALVTLKVGYMPRPIKVMNQTHNVQPIGISRPVSFLFNNDIIAEEGVMTAGAGERIDFTLTASKQGDFMEFHDVMENMVPDSILRYCIDYEEIEALPEWYLSDLGDWVDGLAPIPVVTEYAGGAFVENYYRGARGNFIYYNSFDEFVDKAQIGTFVDGKTGEFFKLTAGREWLPVEEGEKFYGETAFDYQSSRTARPQLRAVRLADNEGTEEASTSIDICPIMNAPSAEECLCHGDYGAHINLVKEDLSNGHFRYKLDITNIYVGDADLDSYHSLVFDYSVLLSENSVCGLQGNANTFWFDWYDNIYSWTSPKAETKVYTFGITVDKVDEGGKALAGAQFKLEQFAGDLIDYPDVPRELFNEDWHMVTPGGYAVQDEHGREHLSADAPYTLAEDGSFIWKDNVTTFTFKGLSEGYYRLTEVKAPAGYSTVDPIYFSVGDKYSLYTSANSGKTVEDITISSCVYDDGNIYPAAVNDWNTEHLHATGTNLDGMATLNVVNVPGVLLPQTGGEGVAMLYIAGASLILLVGYIVICRRKYRV